MRRVTAGTACAALVVSVVGTGGSVGAAADTCAGLVPTIVGTERKDTLVGTEGPDVIAGLGGNDEFDGLGGADALCGGRGADTSGQMWDLDKPHPTRGLSPVQADSPATNVMAGYPGGC